jgi:arylsulfatase A
MKRFCIAGLLASFLVFGAEARPSVQRPNVLLVVADDLGWADLPAYGNRFHETPFLDRLAREGVRFTQFYSGAVCSPTRSNLQSGRHEARYGITQHIPGHRRPFAKLIDPAVPLQLPLEVETVAERLGEAGYATGYFGKWHLGGPGCGPADQGWQTVLELKGHDTPASVTGSEAKRTAAFLTEKAVEFIEAHREAPFLVQVSHYAVHLPLSTRPELLKKYRGKVPMPGFPSRPDYAGLLEELDESVGGLLAALDRLGLAENTLVVFVSDNGGLVHAQDGEVYTSNAPLRGEKGTLYEGGIRVPAMARLPGVIPAGSVCEVPAGTTDLHPTFLELAGVTVPEGRDRPDGISLVPVLRDPSASLPREVLFWHLPHYHHSTPASAVRKGDWKLIEFYEDGTRELYDLAKDPGESKNLAGVNPDKTTELAGDLANWREAVGARMPVPNPAYDPARAGELAKGGKRSGE